MASPSLAPSYTSPPSPIPLFFLWQDKDLFGLWWFHLWVLFWIGNWSLIWGAKREERRFLGLIWDAKREKDIWGWGRSWESDLKRKEHRLGERDKLWGERKNQLDKWEEREKLNKKIINANAIFVRTVTNCNVTVQCCKSLTYLTNLIKGVFFVFSMPNVPNIWHLAHLAYLLWML